MKHIIGTVGLLGLLACGGAGQDRGMDILCQDCQPCDCGCPDIIIPDQGQDLFADVSLPCDHGVQDVGQDDSGNDVTEVSQPVICEGDYVVSNAAEAEAILDCTHITGTLTVNAQGMPELSLPNLLSIENDLVIHGNDALESLEFCQLVVVGGRLAIFDNLVLSSIEFPFLSYVGWYLTIHLNPLLSTFDFPSLGMIDVHLIVAGNAALTTFSFPLLTSLGHTIEIGDYWSGGNPVLTSFDIPSLSTVHGSVVVFDNPSLTTVSFPSLSGVDGHLFLGGHTYARPELHGGNKSLESISFPSLSMVSNGVSIGDNDSLEYFSLPKLTAVPWEEAIEILGNDKLTNFELPVYEQGSLTIAGNHSLTTFEVPALATGGHIRIGEGPAWNPDSLGGNGLLESFTFTGLTSVGTLIVNNHASLTSFAFPALHEVQNHLNVVNNVSLAQCLVDALVAQVQSADGISGDIDTHDNNEACTCEEVGGETVATCPPEAP